MRLLRNISRPLALIALAATPIVAVACGSSSSRLSDEEFCAKLSDFQSASNVNSDASSPEALKAILPLIADLAKNAPNDELKKALETMGPIIEKMSSLDENDPDAFGEMMSLMFDPAVASAGKVIETYSTDVCKFPPTTDSSSIDDSSMTFPPSVMDVMDYEDVNAALEPLKSTNYPNGYISSAGFEGTADGGTLVTVDFADTDTVDAVAVCEAIDAAITEKSTDTNVSIKVSVDGIEVGGRPVGGTCSAK